MKTIRSNPKDHGRDWRNHKGKKNQQQGFMYRGVDDVMNALQPLLIRYNVFAVPEIINQLREERQTKSGGT